MVSILGCGAQKPHIYLTDSQLFTATGCLQFCVFAFY